MRNREDYMLEFIRKNQNVVRATDFFDILCEDIRENTSDEEDSAVVTYESDEVIEIEVSEEKISQKNLLLKLENKEILTEKNNI